MDGPLCCDLGAGRVAVIFALWGLGVRVAREGRIATASSIPQFISVFLIVRAVDVCDRLVSERMVSAGVDWPGTAGWREKCRVDWGPRDGTWRSWRVQRFDLGVL